MKTNIVGSNEIYIRIRNSIRDETLALKYLLGELGYHSSFENLKNENKVFSEFEKLSKPLLDYLNEIIRE
jgi:hypothetical protein